MTSPKRAVLYLRLSRQDDASTSIDRQSADLHALADREGWTVVRTLDDDGISGRKSRAKADEALRMLRDGEADVLAVFKFDRWSRQGLATVAALVNTLDERPEASFVALHDGLRSTQPAWRIIASVLAEVARMEAENTAMRVASMRADILGRTDRESQRHITGRAPFGYRSVKRPDGKGMMLVPDPYERDTIVEGARRLLNGERITDLTRWLNAERVPTSASPKRRARQNGAPTEELDGGEWRVTTVRKLWSADTLIGRTTQRVEVGKRDDGSPMHETRALTDSAGIPIQRWEPLIDADTFLRLQRLLPQRGRNQARKSSSWLTGVIYCGVCGSVLYVNPRTDGRGASLRCANRAYVERACNGATINQQVAETLVEERLLATVGALPERELREVITNPDTHQELDDLRLAIEEAQAAFGRDGVTDYAELVARIESLKARRRELLNAPAEVRREWIETGRTFGEAWRELAEGKRFDAMREHLRQAIDHVSVLRAGEPGAKLSPEERVVIHWQPDVNVDPGEGESRGPSSDPSKRRAPRAKRV